MFNRIHVSTFFILSENDYNLFKYSLTSQKKSPLPKTQKLRSWDVDCSTLKRLLIYFLLLLFMLIYILQSYKDF